MVPLEPDTALGIEALSALPDIHDRLIVAEARAQNAALITRDAAVTAARLVITVW
jgi:PIN domain nuclease of toxin-antitoxin system